MKLPQFLLSLFILLFVQACQPKLPVAEEVSAGLSTERLMVYENFLKQEISEGRLPGAVSLVMRNGQIAHNATFGFSSVADQTVMNSDDIFFIQSMTKPLITVAIMMLYEEGYFLLNDPVSKYLPQFKDRRVVLDVSTGKDGASVASNKEITMAHLLSHTAGLSHGLGASQLDRDYMEAMYMQPHKDVKERMNSMLELPLLGHPGEQWAYSAAPDVLSVLIEQFSGMTTESFLQTRIFDPLGMDNTGYNIPSDKQNRVVQLHNRNREGVLVNSERQPAVENNTIFSGVNAIFSTAPDYMTFSQMLLNNGELNGKRYLSRKTIELMTINHVGDLMGRGSGFGLGFGVITDLADNKIIGSEGQYYWSGANCTYFFIDPKENMVAILMSQAAPYSNYYGDKMRQFVYQAIDD